MSSNKRRRSHLAKPPKLVSKKSIDLSSPDNKENVEDLLKFLTRSRPRRPKATSFDLCEIKSDTELSDMLDFLNS